MQYEQTLALPPVRLDELNRLLEGHLAEQAEGAVLERFGVLFDNEYVMQLWIVNCKPEPLIQAVLWDSDGGRVSTSPFLPGPVEGKYELEPLPDSFIMWICEGP